MANIIRTIQFLYKHLGEKKSLELNFVFFPLSKYYYCINQVFELHNEFYFNGVLSKFKVILF